MGLKALRLPLLGLAVGLGLIVATVPMTPGWTAPPGPSPTPAPSPPADSAVAYQIGPGHSGAQASDSLTPGLVKKYSETCQWDVSYPLIAGGKIFYLCGGVLTAVDLATGNYTTGGKNFYPNHGWSAIAYDGGKVFDLLDSGQLTAIDELVTQCPGDAEQAGRLLDAQGEPRRHRCSPRIDSWSARVREHAVMA